MRLGDSGQTGEHVVRPGETLFSIAFAHGLETRQLAAANDLQEPFILQPGQRLQLTQAEQDGPATNQQKPTTESVASSTDTAYGKSVAAPKAEQKQSAGQASSGVSEDLPNTGEVSWQWPSQNTLSSPFSTRDDGQQALLFRGEVGDDVLAAAGGQVVYTGSALRSYGRLIIIKHNDDYLTAYGHNEEILVQEQQWVAAGQRIAKQGQSGRDNVRLRFELRYRGQAVNPENYLPVR